MLWDNRILATEKRGKFITFEGIDGCGKTTQLRLLAESLRAEGRDIVETVEPGGTEIGRLIRKILLDPASKEITRRAELLLYFASRAQNVEQVIRPALERGAIVLCDRFTDSTLCYQGCGRGLDAQMILDLDQIACAGLHPDLTILIDIDVATSQERAHRRNERTATNETRLDDESTAFHDRVRKGYHALSKQHPERFLVINGAPKAASVAKTIRQELSQHV
jgi:dTMP kinase